MPCYHPLKAWPKKSLSPNGKRGITFSRSDAFVDRTMEVPCGQCIGCRLERSRQWAVRIMHEAQLHDETSFITLTYSPENLPPNGSLRKADFQKFMKRLRKEHSPRTVRYFHAGEYGEALSRPHYHACMFGYDPADKQVSTVRGGNPVWRSDQLERLWPAGFSEVGTLTFESAAYVARYILKKVTGPSAETHYPVINPLTGEELGEREPEYVTMSRRPGIGARWYEQFHSEVYPGDEVISRGRWQKPPRYYDRLLEESDPGNAMVVRERRRRETDHANNRESRLAVREEVTRARLSTYSRRELEE